ncbi:hypothetical protein RDWZM_009447 [Blomia tropicalis]|uniref:mRNA m(6)A methyltransferase n=1 Tax=Blomia tropicalis TaxID=40697 RepID=A0A9Q0RLB7_BLOTA|nr:hypothetical protein RDWZM_009447 [Blomia tropicalis]
MNSNDECDPSLQPIKRRFKERIQKWKKQRQSIFSDSSSQSANSFHKKVELKIANLLCDKSLKCPIDFSYIAVQLSNLVDEATIKAILNRFSTQKFIDIVNGTNSYISAIDHKNLEILKENYDKELNESQISKPFFPDETVQGDDGIEIESKDGDFIQIKSTVDQTNQENENNVECILSLKSAKEKQNKKISEEILDLLSKPSAKEQSLVEQFRSSTGHVQEYCKHGTREECKRVKRLSEPCMKLHFLKIIQKHTDESLGDCSFLNTCFHMESCKYVHYKVEVKDSPVRTNKAATTNTECSDDCNNTSKSSNNIPLMKTIASATEQPFKRVLFPSQWIRCDLRFFDMSILGKFSVVMADPPWDIHMELPYGTMSDDEMRNLNIPCLQDDGVIFLWVTGRAMELGRECLKLWGYERCDELIWVKTNQLQRIIRTGRTGHWINHGKEHCLVGMKVRATSHKPDEIYGIIERLSPGTRKIELFGRQHNTQPNWVTLGNQLDGIRIVDPQLMDTYRKRYPDEARLILSTEETT